MMPVRLQAAPERMHTASWQRVLPMQAEGLANADATHSMRYCTCK